MLRPAVRRAHPQVERGRVPQRDGVLDDDEVEPGAFEVAGRRARTGPEPGPVVVPRLVVPAPALRPKPREKKYPKCCSRPIRRPPPAGVLGRGFVGGDQGPVEVGEEVGGFLQPDRQPQQPGQIPVSSRSASVRWACVGAGRVDDERAHVPDVGHPGEELDGVHEALRPQVRPPASVTDRTAPVPSGSSRWATAWDGCSGRAAWSTDTTLGTLPQPVAGLRPWRSGGPPAARASPGPAGRGTR